MKASTVSFMIYLTMLYEWAYVVNVSVASHVIVIINVGTFADNKLITKRKSLRY